MRCTVATRHSMLLHVVVIAACLAGCDDDDAGQAQQDTSDVATTDQSGDTTVDTSADDLANDVTDTRPSDDVSADTATSDLADSEPPQDVSDAVDTTTDATDVATDVADAADIDLVDPDAPTCTILQPGDGSAQPYSQSWDFVASAVDPQDGVLSGQSVVWSTDRTSTPLGTGAQVSATLEGSGEFVVTCTAYDADGNSGSDSITITLESPIAEIFHPGNGETRQVSNGPFPFVGQADDAETGSLTGSSLVWTTTVNGTTTEIGTGTMFDAVLPEGTNEVTLTATDPDGNVGTDTIIVVMTP